MEENTSTTETKSSMGKILVPIVVVGIIVIAVIAYYVMGQKNTAVSTTGTPENAMQAVTTAPTAAMQAPTGTEAATSAATYKDGTYAVEGNYVTPGGPREVDVNVTLKGNVITAATFKGLATDPTSKRFQSEFGENFEPMVVGKNIDEVSLTKVSGSSLTPKGFMDALEKVKTEAQS